MPMPVEPLFTMLARRSVAPPKAPATASTPVEPRPSLLQQALSYAGFGDPAEELYQMWKADIERKEQARVLAAGKVPGQGQGL